MGQSYYYFAASLPMLEFGGETSMSAKDFLSECRNQLSTKDYETVMQAIIPAGKNPATNNAMLNEWNRYNELFRNELTWFRASEANKDPANYVRGERAIDPRVIDALAETVKSEDPLSAEKLLDRIRWQKLEELAQGHYFDLEVIIVYAIQLSILERYQSVKSPLGGEIFGKYRKEAVELLNKS